jgi:WD40 repeat protein
MSAFFADKQSTLRGHRDCVYTLVQETPNRFFSAGGDGLVVRWDLANPDQGTVVVKVPTSVYAMFYDEQRNWLVVGQNHEGLRIIDLANGREEAAIKVGSQALFDICRVGDHLVVATGAGEIVAVDYNSLKLIHRFAASPQRARTIAVNRSSSEIAIGFSDHAIRIYDTTHYRLKRTLAGHTNSVFVVHYTPNQRYLISGGRDAHLRIWDVEKNYQLTESIVAHMYAINHLDFSPSGRYFATGSMDKSVKVWDAQTFKLLKVIDKARHAGHGTSVNRVLWMHGSDHFLLSASDDRTISVWHWGKNDDLLT